MGGLATHQRAEGEQRVRALLARRERPQRRRELERARDPDDGDPIVVGTVPDQAVAGTDENNGTYTIASVSTDGRTVTVQSTKLTDEGVSSGDTFYDHYSNTDVNFVASRLALDEFVSARGLRMATSC